ncbi:aspartyl protease family protein [Granulicella cerasi]|uniref:Aspartyl protease family protein n=1 Tax=Granulicella cerasi TaxID=741063 RepID=A0ABW1Z8S5_9BACT|nr:aspartyl protease family protein [Granulicella cerasi]
MLSFLPHRILRASVFILTATLTTARLKAQTACTIQPEEHLTAVQQLIKDKKAQEAYDLARKNADALSADTAPEADFVKAQSDLLRAGIFSRQYRRALTDAEAALKRYPQSAILNELVGWAHFSRGEISLAIAAYETALKLDPCSARIHFDIARYNHLNEQHVSEQKQLRVAHQLAPNDPTITKAWKEFEANSLSASEITDRTIRYLARTDLSPKDRAAAEHDLAVTQSYSKGSCHITHPVEKTTIPMVDVGLAMTYAGLSIGLNMSFNDKPATLQIDTGASGITISQRLAKAVGLVSEARVSTFGVGSDGNMAEDTAHVEKLRIGALEFENCMVHIMRSERLHQDGLIGTDVFAPWVVTLDANHHQLRLSPLPPLPGESAENTSLPTFGYREPATPRNRYTPPQFATWTPVYRQHHLLLFPTSVNEHPARLFIMDTGASAQGVISIDAAREATNVEAGGRTVVGLSGKSESMDTGDYTLTFAHVRDQYMHVPALPLYQLETSGGVNISGLIGFSTLQKLVISIDYRDSLVLAIPIAKAKSSPY